MRPIFSIPVPPVTDQTPPGSYVPGADGRPTQIVSLPGAALRCVRCQAPLPVGARALCPACVEVVKRGRKR